MCIWLVVNKILNKMHGECNIKFLSTRANVVWQVTEPACLHPSLQHVPLTYERLTQETVLYKSLLYSFLCNDVARNIYVLTFTTYMSVILATVNHTTCKCDTTITISVFTE